MIYLDHAATTPMVDAAIEALDRQVRHVGNASSLHTAGRTVRHHLEESREVLAPLIGSEPSEVIFTSSGTESNNLAIKGLYWKRAAEDVNRRIIITSSIEHHAVLDPVDWLVEYQGAQKVEIPVSPSGYVDLDFLSKFLGEHCKEIALISVMHSNNEVGSVQPIRQIVELAGEIPVHTDAVQSFTKVDFNFRELGVEAATISAHKIGGPLGVAALVLKRGIDLTPLLHGGGQERELRSGTMNVPGVVSFATAARLAVADFDQRNERIRHLKDEFIKLMKSRIPDITINGSHDLPGIANITFHGTENEGLLMLLDTHGVASSTGSACSAGVAEPSHVLLAMGLDENTARSTLRFSFGSTNTESELDQLAEILPSVVAQARRVLA